ncbi:hypothetical protein D4764_16G0003670 [Takifugu flavidus]|uniref:Uncharacterized protein n=1 Tax=Takifugu flavidus TaxID=433684 RepID=A0A5C6P1A0_9TELE|nr:hypothetical protein D4764_16G0003670 [Takifugu flavidus]
MSVTLLSSGHFSNSPHSFSVLRCEFKVTK